MKRITDPTFKYRPSYDTDLKKRFAKILREQKKNAEERVAKVEQLPKRKAHG